MCNINGTGHFPFLTASHTPFQHPFLHVARLLMQFCLLACFQPTQSAPYIQRFSDRSASSANMTVFRFPAYLRQRLTESRKISTKVSSDRGIVDRAVTSRLWRGNLLRFLQHLERSNARLLRKWCIYRKTA